jgi:hypothetical protein
MCAVQAAHQVEELLRIPRLGEDDVVEAAQLLRVRQTVCHADRRAGTHRLPHLSETC